MTKALEHFLPNVDLNLQSLKEVVRSISSNIPGENPSLALSETGDSIINVKTAPSVSGQQDTSSSTAGTAVTIEEIDELHGELGWLRVDSRGTYRETLILRLPVMNRT